MARRSLPIRIHGLLAAAAVLGFAVPAAPAADLAEAARRTVAEAARGGVAAPDFGRDHVWLNVERPLTLREDLQGRVLLLDFWTYGCINCLHLLPDLAFLEEKYAAEPFGVVGCHSAKFANEAEAENIRRTVERLGIAHPVVVDRDRAIWKRYGVEGWPTLVLIGPDGTLLGRIPGEGRREELDALVRAALDHYGRVKGALAPRPLPLRPGGAAGAGFLRYPAKLAADPKGRRLFIADAGRHRIVVADFRGEVERVIGGEGAGYADGEAGAARFRTPQGVALHGGALFVADAGNHAIRRVDLPTGRVETVAGTGRKGAAVRGTFDARKAELNSPWDLLGREDSLFVAMAGTHQIWRLDLRLMAIHPFAGDGSEGRRDGTRGRASFAQPSGLAEKDGVLFVADAESSSIRAVGLLRDAVGTAAGGGPDPSDLFHFGDEDGRGPGRRFQHPLGIARAGGLLYAADAYNHKVKTVDPGTGEVKTLAGTGRPGNADGPFATASFHEPSGIAAAAGFLYVVDTNNHAIRILDLEKKTVSTLRILPPR